MLGKFIEEINWYYDKGFEQCEGHNDKLYLCSFLATSRLARGRGIASQLLKKSIDHAKEQGCSHMYVMASGKYSQKIFRNHGFYIINEKTYESFRDKDGKQVIMHDVHTSAQVVALKLN